MLKYCGIEFMKSRHKPGTTFVKTIICMCADANSNELKRGIAVDINHKLLYEDRVGESRGVYNWNVTLCQMLDKYLKEGKESALEAAGDQSDWTKTKALVLGSFT